MVEPTSGPAAQLARERRFFFICSLVMALVVVGGFSAVLALGVTSFSVPPVFHLHAAAFFGWIALYVTQNWLVMRGRIVGHRWLGRTWLVVIPAMVVFGPLLTVASFRLGKIPPFYDLREFLFGVAAQLGGFLALAGAGLWLRDQTDWHKRLMFCATALLTKAGFDRLLPVPLFGAMAWWAGALPTYLFPLAGMLHDRRQGRPLHPAWFFGIGVMAAVHLVAALVSHSPFAGEVVKALVAGTAGAGRPIEAFWPN